MINEVEGGGKGVKAQGTLVLPEQQWWQSRDREHGLGIRGLPNGNNKGKEAREAAWRGML